MTDRRRGGTSPTTNRRQLLGAWAPLVVAAALLCGCGEGGSAPVAVQGGSVTVRLTGDWGDLNPQTLQTTLPANQVDNGLYDRLVATTAGGKVIPYLATSWKATASAITFTLRRDATCADGTPVTPTVVKNDIAALVKTSTASQLFGPGPYATSADDAAGTVTLSVGTPFVDLLYGFTQPSSSIICRTGLASPASLANASSGSGPYTIASSVHGDSIVLKARPDWKWGANGLTTHSPGFPQQVTLKVVNNETTAANLLLSGGLDIANITGSDLNRLLANKQLKTFVAHGFEAYPLAFNERPGHPTADDAVREALMTAIDAKAWNQAAYAGRGVVSSSFMTPTSVCFDPATRSLIPSPSVARAKSILQAAGYTLDANGKFEKGGKPLVIKLIGTDQLYGNGPEYVAAQWSQVGVSVDSQITDYATFRVAFGNAGFDVTPVAGGSGPNASASGYNFFTGVFPPRGTNFAGVVDPDVESAIQVGLQTTGCDNWKKAQELLLKRHHIVPLSAPDSYYFSHGLDLVPAPRYPDLQFIKRVS